MLENNLSTLCYANPRNIGKLFTIIEVMIYDSNQIFLFCQEYVCKSNILIGRSRVLLYTL